MNNNGPELEQVIHTHRISCLSSWPIGFGALNPNPLSEYLPPSQRFHSSLLLIHFRYGPNACSNYTKVWHTTYPICGAPLSRSERRSFALLQRCVSNSPFLHVKWSPIRYGTGTICCLQCVIKSLHNYIQLYIMAKWFQVTGEFASIPSTPWINQWTLFLVSNQSIEIQDIHGPENN